MKRTLATVISLATVASLSLAFAPVEQDAALPVPEGAAHEEVYFPSTDGTMLQADVLKPEGGCPAEGCPVILSIGPYFGSGTQNGVLVAYDAFHEGPSQRFADMYTFEDPAEGGKTIFERGYAFVMVDSRGYGESGGCNDYGGIGEQSDAYAAVEYFGKQPWSNGKVGMWGKSYDAWTQVMALKTNPPHLEATVIQAPISDGYGIAWVNGVHHNVGWYLTPFLYTLYDYTPASVPELTPEHVLYPTSGSATDPCWAEQHLYQPAGFDEDLEYWRQRELSSSAGRNDDVAVLWSHGFNDVNTKPDQIFSVYEPLNRWNPDKTRAWFGTWAHDRGNEADVIGRDGFLTEALDWFDYYLKGEDFAYEANAQNVVEVQDNEGQWRTEAQYPPVDTVVQDIEMRLDTYTDNGSSSGGYWTVSQPLEHDVRIVGEPRLTVAGDFPGPVANFVGVLYDIDETGVATEIARTAVLLENGQTKEVRMFPRDHVLRPGHRLAFHVTSGHPEFFPYSTNQDVTLTQLTVGVPYLTYAREINLSGGPSTRSPYRRTPSAADLEAGTVELPLPPAPRMGGQQLGLQPRVSTGCDHNCDR